MNVAPVGASRWPRCSYYENRPVSLPV
jgi:hypothetical protein